MTQQHKTATLIAVLAWMTFVAIIILAIAWSCTSAPGARTLPHRSRIGKVGFQHPGVSFQIGKIRNAITISRIEKTHKLIPRSGIHGDNSIIYRFDELRPEPFNIIVIIIQMPAKEYSVTLFRTRLNNDRSQSWNIIPIREILPNREASCDAVKQSEIGKHAVALFRMNINN